MTCDANLHSPQSSCHSLGARINQLNARESRTQRIIGAHTNAHILISFIKIVALEPCGCGDENDIHMKMERSKMD